MDDRTHIGDVKMTDIVVLLLLPERRKRAAHELSISREIVAHVPLTALPFGVICNPATPSP